MHEFNFALSEPAFIRLDLPGGAPPVRIDVYEARRAMEHAQNNPDEARRHAAILDWLAGKLGVPRDSLAESQAVEFSNLVVHVVGQVAESRKKKLGSIACSPGSTQESPATSANGP